MDSAARKIQKFFRTRRGISGPGFKLTAPRVVSTATTLDASVNLSKIYTGIPKGFDEVVGYVNLRGAIRIRFSDGKWIGKNPEGCKYFIAKTKGLAVIMTSSKIEVQGSGNFEEAYLKCIKNGWISKSLIRSSPKYKIINCVFRVNHTINIELLRDFIVNLLPMGMIEEKPKEIIEELRAPSLAVKFKKPKITYQFFKNGTILFSGIKKISDIEVPVEFFKQFFTKHGFDPKHVFSNSEKKATTDRYPLAGTWNSLVNPVPRGYYIRPGQNKMPRLYPYEYYKKLAGGGHVLESTVDLGPIAPKVKKAFEEAGVTIPTSTLEIFRRAGHPLERVTNKKEYAGTKNRRAPAWNAVKNGFYVRPGPGQQPYWYKVPKGMAAGRKTVIDSYSKAGRNIPNSVREIFKISKNVKVNNSLRKHEFLMGSNGILRINGKQATRLTKTQLLAISRNSNIAAVDKKMKVPAIIEYIKKHVAPKGVGKFDFEIGEIKYKLLQNKRVRRLKPGMAVTTREWATMKPSEKLSILRKFMNLNEIKMHNSSQQFNIIYSKIHPPEKSVSPVSSAGGVSPASPANSNFNKELEFAIQLQQNLGNYYKNGNEVNFMKIYKNIPLSARGIRLKTKVDKAYSTFVKNSKNIRKRNVYSSKINPPKWASGNLKNNYRKFLTNLAFKVPKITDKKLKEAAKTWLSARAPANKGSPARNVENAITGVVRRIPARLPVTRKSPSIPARSPPKERAPPNQTRNYVYKIPVNFSNKMEMLGLNSRGNWTWNEIRAALKDEAKLKKLKKAWNSNVVAKASPTGTTSRVKRKVPRKKKT